VIKSERLTPLQNIQTVGKNIQKVKSQLIVIKVQDSHLY